MFRCILIFLFFFYSYLYSYNDLVGKSLLPQYGKTLSGKNIELPDYFYGKFVFVAFGFSRKTQYDFDSWMITLKKKYSDKKNLLFFEIPMIGKKSKFQKLFIQNGMKIGINKSLHDNIMTFYGDTYEYKEYYGFNEENTGYFLLLDKNSTIIWQNSGAATQEDILKLYFILDKLLEGDI